MWVRMGGRAQRRQPRDDEGRALNIAARVSQGTLLRVALALTLRAPPHSGAPRRRRRRCSMGPGSTTPQPEAQSAAGMSFGNRNCNNERTLNVIQRVSRIQRIILYINS